MRPASSAVAITFTFLVAWVSIAAPLGANAEGEASPEPAAVTTGDPSIPSEELELLLKPLTKAQLLVEADAWQGLVQAKAEEISRAEIEVKRQNREIANAEQIQEQAEKAKDKLQAVKEKTDEARQSGGAQAVVEAEKAAKQAKEEMQKVQEQIDEAVESAEKTAEIRGQMSPTTEQGLEETAEAADRAQAAVGKVQQAVEDSKDKSGAESQEAAEEAQQAAQQATQATELVSEKAATLAEEAGSGTAVALDETAATMAKAQEAKKDEKVALLEEVTELREQRTALLDRFEVILEALELKTDEGDTDTLAKIRDYHLYARAVSGIEVDVKDTTSAWIAIKGWVLSEEGGLRWLINIATFIGILIAAWIISGLFSRGIQRALQSVEGKSQLLEQFLVKAVRWVVMAIGLIMARAALELSIGPLLAVVGAAGFVIAFALQDSLSNFASGLMILFFRPFDVGDVVDAGGVSGSVQSMNLVSTTIKTFDSKTMVVPNNKIWNDVITNATGVTERRVDMEFGIGYDDDIDRAQHILEEVVTSHPKVLKDPPATIKMSALADSSVNFICRPWAKPSDYWEVYWDIIKEVKKRFDAEGIGIPYPQRDVHLYIKDTESRDKLRDLSGKSTPPDEFKQPEVARADGGLDT